MARPDKQYLDYFSHDTDMSNDQKVEHLEADYGLIGYSIYVKLLEKIYRNGYFLKFSKRDASVMSRKIDLKADTINDIVTCCLEEDLFNKEKFDDFEILTSSGIQKRYMKACERRKNVEMIRDFLISENGVPEYIFVLGIDEERIRKKAVEKEKKKAQKKTEKEKEKEIAERLAEKEAEKAEKAEKAKEIEEIIVKEYDPEVELLYKLFEKTLKKNGQESYLPKKKQTTEKWLEEIDKAHRIDGFEYWKIADIIVVFRADAFWRDKFFSPLKLRRANKEDIKYLDYFWGKITDSMEAPGVDDVEYIKQAIKDYKGS